MESVFGEPPSASHSSSLSKDFMARECQFVSPKMGGSGLGLTHVGSKGEAQMVDVTPKESTKRAATAMARECQFVSPKMGGSGLGLTHVGSKGEAQMVDVTPKESTKRAATASCKVILGKKVFDLVSANQMAKGDVLSVAKIAGINGAKQTSSLIPLCHNIILTHVRVDLTLNPKDFSVGIVGEAASTGKTGVEMEALTAVSVAGLTVYDMCKAASKDIQITAIQLEHKTGGKSGDWFRKD